MTLPDLDTPLLELAGADTLTVRDVCGGICETGLTGSGKSTSSGALLLKAFFKHGFGALVLCSKPGERARIEAYAREAGREQSLIIFSPRPDDRHQCQWHFNPLEYEFRRGGSGAGLVEACVEVINAIRGMVEGNQGGSEGDSHWQRASDQLIRYAVQLLELSRDRISIDNITQLIMDAPEGDEAEEPQWQKANYFWQTLQKAEQNIQTPRDRHSFRMAKRYWLQTYAGLADRTRSSVYSTFSAIADVLLHDPLYELFCTDTDLVPEASYRDAAIIVLDMPIREYGKAGIVAQRLFKYCWQRAMLRRNVSQHPRPVCLFADEAQNFIDDFDFLFQAESRESLVATVYITQNISNYYAVLGSKSHDEVNALLGHFQTKIFHANTDPVTNQWAAETIGYDHSYRRSWSMGHTELGNSYFSIGGAEQREYKIEPALFTGLSKGGEANDWQVEAVLFQGGRQWQANGDTCLKVAIRQAFAPQPQALAVQDTALTREQQTNLLMVLMDFLLIFLHHGTVMDMYQAMQWQQNVFSPARQDAQEAVTVTCDETQFSVPVPDIAATVQWALTANP